MRINFTVIFTF